MDAYGNPMYTVCGATESELQVTYPNPCNYYKLGGKEYCWYLNSNGVFIKNKPEDYIQRLKQCFNFSNAVKVDCDYCQTWYTRQKNTYKPTNTFAYSPVRIQQYCGDTVHTLYQGRVIVLRETSDSLITVQFSNNGSF